MQVIYKVISPPSSPSKTNKQTNKQKTLIWLPQELKISQGPIINALSDKVALVNLVLLSLFSFPRRSLKVQSSKLIISFLVRYLLKFFLSFKMYD